MKFLKLLTMATFLAGCAAERTIVTKHSDVTINETCTMWTEESVGPQGGAGFVKRLSGYGTIDEPRGKITCESDPFVRTTTKSYGDGPNPRP